MTDVAALGMEARGDPHADAAAGVTDAPLPPALVASPRQVDAEVIMLALRDCGIPAVAVTDADHVRTELASAGCLVVTQESLTPAFLDDVAQALATQPAWSELPVIVILAADALGQSWRKQLGASWPTAQVTLLARPLGALELQGAVQLAISARLRQFRIGDQIDQERELRHELRHRVKNIFATVQAIASVTRRTAGDGDPFERFGERLAALGRVHEGLDRVGEEPETFQTLSREVLHPFLAGDRICVTGRAPPLTGSACSMLGLCLFELATNAAKHGALSTADGQVHVSLDGDAEHARLLWTERGGPPARPPSRRGYGSRFLALTLQSLFGSPPDLDYGPTGLSLRVEGQPRGLFMGPTCGSLSARTISSSPWTSR